MTKPITTPNISPWDIAAQQAYGERLKAKGDVHAQIEHAARGFENILVRQWVELARKPLFESNEGPMSGYDKMVNDQLAHIVSGQGGIGLAQTMVDQMMTQIKNRDWAAVSTDTNQSAQGASK
jgi:Rod binding domain-containing protein